VVKDVYSKVLLSFSPSILECKVKHNDVHFKIFFGPPISIFRTLCWKICKHHIVYREILIYILKIIINNLFKENFYRKIKKIN